MGHEVQTLMWCIEMPSLFLVLKNLKDEFFISALDLCFNPQGNVSK